ncbi:RDD family protein [Simiduia litorea]|uniref:RDD family protein n=1 Tax=Simiduia litorea TaxID=1435348 RepID=UPI0036F2A0AE
MNNLATQYPSIFRRLGAMLYDSLLVIALCLAYGALVLWGKVALFDYNLAAGEKASIGLPGFAGMLGLIALYFCFFWVRSGQTLGMKTWRIQILDETGKYLSLGQAVKRWLLACVSTVALGLGYLWSIIDKDSQTLHDLLSHSRTVLLPKGK